MNVVRINSFHRDGLTDYKGSTLVVCCGLDDEQKVARGVWPGVITNDNLKTPFLLKVDDQSVVWFNDDDFPVTTFGQREIHPKQLFTVDKESVYEVGSTYQYLNPERELNGNLLHRMVKLMAVCVDSHRKTKNDFVLWCGLDEAGCVVDGEWMGYYEDDEAVWPIFVSIGSYSEVNYGDNIKDPTDLKSGQVGHHFIIKGTDKNNNPDTYKYEVIEQVVL